MKVEIMKKFVGLTAKTYTYLKDHNDEDKIEKDTKRCENKINHLEKNKHGVYSHEAFTKNVIITKNTAKI